MAVPEIILAFLGTLFLTFAYTLPVWVLAVFVGAWLFAMLMIFLDGALHKFGIKQIPKDLSKEASEALTC